MLNGTGGGNNAVPPSEPMDPITAHERATVGKVRYKIFQTKVSAIETELKEYNELVSACKSPGNLAAYTTVRSALHDSEQRVLEDFERAKDPALNAQKLKVFKLRHEVKVLERLKRVLAQVVKDFGIETLETYVTVLEIEGRKKIHAYQTATTSVSDKSPRNTVDMEVGDVNSSWARGPLERHLERVTKDAKNPDVRARRRKETVARFVLHQLSADEVRLEIDVLDPADPKVIQACDNVRHQFDHLLRVADADQVRGALDRLTDKTLPIPVGFPPEYYESEQDKLAEAANPKKPGEEDDARRAPDSGPYCCAAGKAGIVDLARYFAGVVNLRYRKPSERGCRITVINLIEGSEETAAYQEENLAPAVNKHLTNQVAGVMIKLVDFAKRKKDTDEEKHPSDSEFANVRKDMVAIQTHIQAYLAELGQHSNEVSEGLERANRLYKKVADLE